MTQTLDVTAGPIWKHLVKLVIPVFLAIVIQQTYAFINTFILGHYSTLEELGGIQVTQSLTDLVVGASVGIGAGCAVICGQYFGAHDDKNLARSVVTALLIAGFLGISLSVAARLLSPQILAVMGTPQELYEPAKRFTDAFFLVMPASLLFNTGSAILRAVGDTRTPALILGCSCMLNIGFDVLFIVWLQLGAAGAAWAVICSVTISASLVILKLCHEPDSWRLRLSRLRPRWAMVGPMLICGVPLGIQSACYSLSNIVVQANINSFGTNAVNAWGLSTRIDTLIWVCAESVGVAITAFAAQNFGAKHYERLRAGIRWGLILVGIAIGTIGTMVFFAAPFLASLFISHAEIEAQTVAMVRYLSYTYLLYGGIVAFSGTMRGCGESVGPMAITLVGTCLLRIVWVEVVVAQWHTMDAILLCYPLTYLLTLATFIAYYFSGIWLKRAKRRADQLDQANKAGLPAS